MKRVMVIGGPGSGKSTLAKRLGARTGLPVHHLDMLHWRPGWEAPAQSDWVRCVSDLVAGEKWIMDGGYSNTFSIRMPRADTILWLDPPPALCFTRVMRRLLLNWGRTREDVAPGCPERFHLPFLRYVWTFRRVHAAKYRLALDRFAPQASVMIFTTTHEANRFVKSLSR